MDKIGVVVIGRNEGDRLKLCLQSVLNEVGNIVYVDSGSSDDSVAYAESKGVDVVQLDMSIPFSAGRARNKGFHYIVNDKENIEYVQFIDGDCELSAGWLEFATKYLDKNYRCAVAAGRVKERFPEKSIYNLLCDIEWDTPIGETKACGGIFMVRKKRVQDVNGFNVSVIAGEEPELCYRLRQNRWQIYRLDHLMVFHDAAITKFSQWWKRAIRSGHAYAQLFALHGTRKERHCFKDSLRIWFWALIFPGLAFFLSLLFNPWFWLLLLAYAAQCLKIAININKRIVDWKHSFLYSFFNVIGKWPQFYGQLDFILKKISRTRLTIIEYK